MPGEAINQTSAKPSSLGWQTSLWLAAFCSYCSVGRKTKNVSQCVSDCNTVRKGTACPGFVVDFLKFFVDLCLIWKMCVCVCVVLPARLWDSRPQRPKCAWFVEMRHQDVTTVSWHAEAAKSSSKELWKVQYGINSCSSKKPSLLWWLEVKRTQVNRVKTCKLRKRLYHFDNTYWMSHLVNTELSIWQHIYSISTANTDNTGRETLQVVS